MLQVLSRFSFDLLARAYENGKLESFVDRILSILNKEPELAFEYLKEIWINKVNKGIDLLLVCPEQKTRKLYGKLLASVFNLVIEHNGLSLESENEVDENGENLFDDNIDTKKLMN